MPLTPASPWPCRSTRAVQPVDSSPITSTADIYCNPVWVTVEGRNSIAQPGDALFYSGAKPWDEVRERVMLGQGSG